MIPVLTTVASSADPTGESLTGAHAVRNRKKCWTNPILQLQRNYVDKSSLFVFAIISISLNSVDSKTMFKIIWCTKLGTAPDVPV